MVDASTGGRSTIANWLGRSGRAASLEYGAIRGADVSDGVRQGVLPTYEVVTRTGRRIRATPNHPFLTFGGWRALQDLWIGARIGVPRRLPIFGDREMRLCEIDMLGLLISDGACATPGASPCYTSGDPLLRDCFADAVRAFGGVARPVGRMGMNATNNGHRGGRMEPNRVYRWLQSMGLAVKSPEKKVPEIVFELRRPLVARFLRALFSGDGGISVSGGAVMLEFCSTSERLARDVHHLLLRFGIVAALRHRETDSGMGAFIICVTSKDAVVSFAREIGFVPGCEKQKRLESALDYIESSPQRKSNFDTFPRAAWGLLRSACAERGVSLRSMGVMSTQPDQSVPRQLVRDLAARLDHELLSSHAESDVLWDTIREIRYTGVEEVYDLTLPETENFVANDVIVHNSTYARCGIITNVTPFEPEWEGFATLEVSNTTPLPAKIYANEGIAQVLFFESDEQCIQSYADKKGKYQSQVGITLPKL
ncbi:MAG: LAGLIDADG family homing endonuclease [bacterium]